MYVLKYTSPTGTQRYVGKRHGYSYRGYCSTEYAVEFADKTDAMTFLQNHKDFKNGGYVPIEIEDVITSVDGHKMFIEKNDETNSSGEESGTKTKPISFSSNNIKSSVPKTVHINTVQITTHENSNSRMTDEHISDLIEQLREGVDKITNVYKELDKAYAYCQKSLDDVNWEIIDIEHAVELYNMNAYDAFKMTSQLKEKRKTRRLYKDFFAVMERLEKDNNMFGFQNGATSNALHALDHRQYTPRKMEGLFEDLDKKYKHNM